MESNRGDHDHHKVEDPVARSGQRVSRSPNLQRHNLGRVQPGHTEPPNGKAGVEDEQEDSAGDIALASMQTSSDGQDDHGNRHASSTEEHKGTTAKLLDSKHGNPRGQEVLGSVARCHDARNFERHVEAVFQDNRNVVGNQVDT